MREFVESGAAREYRGFADVVSAGFPCQPFSVAGAGAGEDDERNMWPATLAVIRDVRPRFALLENVPGLLAHTRYFGQILGELAESGYDARWRCLSAAELGAPHRRDRLWIVAHSNSYGRIPFGQCIDGEESRDTSAGGELPDAKRELLRDEPGRGSGQSRAGEAQPGHDGADGRVERFIPVSWWSSTAGVCRTTNVLAHRVDRLRALGNGQVPAVAARAWQELTS